MPHLLNQMVSQKLVRDLNNTFESLKFKPEKILSAEKEQRKKN